jgi:hypothetical protein
MSKPLIPEEKDLIYRSADYRPILSNWFSAKPYGFRFTSRKGKSTTMYLPLGPSNLSIVTQFATNLIPTITGTVEEHSPVRYYDITIEGTTGMVPKFVEPVDGTSQIPREPGRSAFTIQQTLDAALFTKTLSAADKVVSAAKEFAMGRSTVTGVYLDQTGYLAFHNLYRFFLKYKKDVAGVDDKAPRATWASAPLVFFNLKDNNQYTVVIKSFMLRRDKENPMLYFYNISLRGYDLKDATNDNEYKALDSKQLLTDLGLDGVKSSTYLSWLKEKADLARDMLSSVANGVNQLGR